MAEYNEGLLDIQNRQFEGRLQSSHNGTTLRISGLTMNDSNVFKADIILISSDIHTMYFNLTVYEPVPVPSITAHLEGDNKTQCEFTLHCSVPINTSLILFSWMYRCGNSGYQHYANGSTLAIMLQNLSKTTDFLCLAQNPADEKNASFRVQQICQYGTVRGM
ncbi:SLAM family member 8-like [Xenopus laevis]|nr:SLAM family member 8-like [Xenopus laevis]